MEQSLVGSLRQVLRSFVLQDLEIDAFAELLGTSRRSMQRQLMRDGTTFSKLREEARFEKAREILTDPDVSITELASALGYQHPTHFSRAFRRIAGVSPRQYRKAQTPDRALH